MQTIYLDIIVVIQQSVNSGEQSERKHDKANKTTLDRHLESSRESNVYNKIQAKFLFALLFLCNSLEYIT